MLDFFEVSWPHGHHACLVHQPLGMSLFQLMKQCPDKVFTEDLLKATILRIFLALDYLHTEAHLIHTGASLILSIPIRS